MLEMTEVLKETSSANATQLRLIREELSELISEMRAILLIVRPDLNIGAIAVGELGSLFVRGVIFSW